MNINLIYFKSSRLWIVGIIGLLKKIIKIISNFFFFLKKVGLIIWFANENEILRDGAELMIENIHIQ